MKAPDAPKGTCRGCGATDLGKNRTRWCSNTCSDKFRELTYATFYRVSVWNRAHGRCEGCGWNLKAHIAQIKKWQAMCRQQIPDVNLATYFQFKTWISQAVAKVGGNASKGPSLGLWEVDHIVPLIEGGLHSLDNLRLLCIRCHKAETRALAARRRKATKDEPARSRRRAKAVPTGRPRRSR